MIRFPEGTSSRRIRQQFHQRSLARIIESLMYGELSDGNFSGFLKERISDPVVFSRNSDRTIRSVRYKNRWKLIYDFATDKKSLFDLKRDPGETRDVLVERADTAAFLEELLISSMVQDSRPPHHLPE